MAEAKLFAVGVKGDGVHLFLTEPVRYYKIDLDVENVTLGKVAAQIREFIADSDGNPYTSMSSSEAIHLAEAIDSGATLSDAAFAFHATIDGSQAYTSRMTRDQPIQNAVGTLFNPNPDDGPADDPAGQ